VPDLPERADKVGAGKAEGAFLTIGELANELGVAAHVLRYWETRFPQLKPLQRAGNRRYYRAADAALARRVHRWLTVEGYTIKGVQALLARGAHEEAEAPAPPPAAPPPVSPEPSPADARAIAMLAVIRDELADALAEEERTAGNNT